MSIRLVAPAQALTCCLALSFPALVRAQVARIEMHTFSSTTLSDEDFLAGRKEGRPVTVAAELRIPKTAATSRLPAVVLVHPSGGISGLVDDWASKLNAMGVATFVFDGFTPRGIVSTIDDQSQLGRLALIVDCYRALALLAKHPRIDPNRIALMGFSRGEALYASVTRFQQMHGPQEASFAMYIAFYPSCAATYLHDEDVAPRPVRIFHGAADEWNPVSQCRAYVRRLQGAGKDVRLTEYLDAQHVFDSAALKAPVTFPNGQTTRHCRIEEVSGGRLVNADTKQPFTYADPCVERGTTIAYDARAAADAQRAVAELVERVLKAH
jgi:dienelactone hydrolase